jgi:Leucine-rich repeat (LRR) protein
LLYDLITLGIDTNGDSIISYGEAAAVTTLDITNYYGNYVTDATGLEAFINLSSLTFRCNSVDVLDFSKNTALKKIWVYDNALKEIDVSKCTRLEELHVGSEGYCFKNRLTELDVSANTRLKVLKCGNNQLSHLDVSNNPELEILECHLNQLEEIDLSNNSALLEFSAWNNLLVKLDVSACPLLKVLDFRGNKLTEIDLSNNESLEELDGCRNFISKIHLCCNNTLSRIQLAEMPSLEQVCVWTLPFPPEGVYIDISGESGITFAYGCR